MASLFKRKSQYWVSFYQDGRHIRKSLHTRDARVAKSKLKKLEYELAIGDIHIASKLPLSTILESFCRYLKVSRTFKSYKNDFSRLRVFFGPICESLEPGKSPGRKQPIVDKFAGKHIKAKLLEDITPQVINRFLAARIEQDNWSAKTANLTRQLLHKFFAYATKHHGFVGRDRRYPNPVSAVDRRRERAPQIRFLNLEQIEEQLKVLSEYTVIHVLAATYIYAGLRREEALRLTHEDMDMENRLIRVRAKNIDGESWQPKTKRNRVVPISDALLAILKTYQSPHDCVWFFPSPKGRRWSPDNFSWDLRKVNKANGLDWGCLDYRHTFGSHLAMKGESLYKISTLMGNSPDICRKHYAALIPEQMSDTVEFGQRKTVPRSMHDDEAKAMLKEILEEVRGGKKQDKGTSQLRLIRSGDPA